jgi:hypothetical protein
MKAHGIERLEVPLEHYSFATKRMKPFVEFAASCARTRNLDLTNLAVSSYLQGVWDGCVVQARNKSLPDNWEEEA